MNIKYTVLALALTSATLHADVELKSSDDDNLLINGSAAQLVPHVYDANGQIVDEFKVISLDTFHSEVVLNISNEIIDLSISPRGEIVVSDERDHMSLLNSNCQRIGVIDGDNTFTNITAIVLDFENHPSVYEIGTETIEGWHIRNCMPGDSMTTRTGALVAYSSTLTEAVNTFMESLSTPLSIK